MLNFRGQNSTDQFDGTGSPTFSHKPLPLILIRTQHKPRHPEQYNISRQFHANRRWWRYFRSPFVVRSYDRGPSCIDPRCAPRKRIGVVIVIAWLRDGASLLDTHHTF